MMPQGWRLDPPKPGTRTSRATFSGFGFQVNVFGSEQELPALVEAIDTEAIDDSLVRAHRDAKAGLSA